MSDRLGPNRTKNIGVYAEGEGGSGQEKCEEGRILVNTQWHALQLMREARGQLLTTQR